MRVEIDVNVTLQSDDRTVDVTATAQLFEGTDCDTDDHEDTETSSMTVSAGAAKTGIIHLLNEEFDGGDSADISFTVKNDKQL